MKKIALAVMVACMCGCMPKVMNQSFSPYTTADGETKWRFATVNYPAEADVTPILEYEIGRRQMCPKGWKINNRDARVAAGYDVVTYEGQCR